MLRQIFRTNQRCFTIFPVILLATIFGVASASAEIDDNKGTEFIIGFMANMATSGENVVLFITGDVPTNGTVEIPGLAFSTPFSVTPGAITSVALPLAVRAASGDGTEDKGVRIIADDEVVVYGLNQSKFTTDAFLALPADIMGTDHVVLGFAAASTLEDSEFLVVGLEDDTTVTIDPSMTTGARTEGVPYSISLDRLETYQLISDSVGDDSTGTIITSDKPVAVFGGARCTDIPLGTSFCDHLVEQIPPSATWGVSFLTVPLATRTAGDIFRVVARDDGTDILIDGALAGTINRGDFFEVDLASGTFHEITTSGPALLAQYSKSTTNDNVTSDPFEMLIPPTEQFLNAYTVTTPAAAPVSFNNFINVVVKDTDIPSCTIDGGAFASAFTPIGASGFSGALEPVAIGAHNLSCPNGFGAYSYGFASFDSYGYPGGLALEPIAIEGIVLAPDLDFNPLGTDHTVGAHLSVNVVDPLPSVDVSFSVTAGPNTGDTGNDTTDVDGDAEFIYTGDGGKGADDIVASFVNSDGDTVVSDPARKFWDDDCNENGIPDTCDLDCEGFDGLCGDDFPLCGESLDEDGNGQPDECNLPPDCSSVLADPGELWPPNHEFHDISVVGVTDPDGDPIEITVDSIFQDEPVDGFGDGNTCEDGTGVGTPTASVRAERTGTPRVPGDGRVYHIGISADDGNGGSCNATVIVCVSHNQDKGRNCVDGGPIFDSTVCGDGNVSRKVSRTRRRHLGGRSRGR